MQSSATKLFVLSILLVIVLLVRVVLFSYKQSTTVQDALRFIQQSHDIRYHTQKVVLLVIDYEKCEYAKEAFSDTTLNKSVNTIRPEIAQTLVKLHSLAKVDKIQSKNVENFESVINARFLLLNKGNQASKKQALLSSTDFIDKLNVIAARIEQEEQNRINRFNAINDKTILSINVIFFILGGLVFFLIVTIVVNIEKNNFERKTNKLLLEYLSLIDLSNDAIVTTDADTRILQWSKGAENLYGYLKEEVTGKQLGFVTNPHISEAEMQTILDTINKTGSWRGEMVQYNKNGEKLYLDVSYSRVLNDDGTIKGFSSIRSNITELKLSKQNLQALNNDLEIEIAKKTNEIKEVFERMQKAFLAFDLNWVCTYANHPISTYLNIPHDAIIGRKFQDFFSGITETTFYKSCLEALETQETQELREYVPFFNCWFESSIYPSPNGVSIYVSDITDQKKIEQEIINQKRQLRNLTNHIQRLREEERKIIARELHDDLGQIATILKIDIKGIKNSLQEKNPELLPQIDNTLETVDDLIQKIRKISHQLRPPLLDNVGLKAALKSYCKDYESKTSITCSFFSDLPDKRFNQEIEIALFRICQEALTNVARHANATVVNVNLIQLQDYITLTVDDNGVGFDVNTILNTLGIIGIKERAASINFNLEIESEKGKGTKILASGQLRDVTV